MNRLGIIVDLSHVSHRHMEVALDVTRVTKYHLYGMKMEPGKKSSKSKGIEYRLKDEVKQKARKKDLERMEKSYTILEENL